MRITPLALSVLTSAMLAAPGYANTANQAFELCHAQLAQAQPLAKAPRFHKDVAVKTRDQEFTLMINALGSVDGKRMPLKVECTTNAKGQVTQLDMQPGRWNL